MKILRYGITIVTLLVFIFGTISLIQMSNKIVVTSCNLIILRDNASFYNEQAQKTDKMTENYIQNDEKRQEIYNSQDNIIRWFSNQNTMMKIVILFLSIMLYPMILLVWIREILRTQMKITRKMKQKKRNSRNAQRFKR